MSCLPTKTCLEHYPEIHCLDRELSTYKSSISETVHKAAAFLVEPAFTVIYKIQRSWQKNRLIKLCGYSLLMIPATLAFLLGGALKLMFTRNPFSITAPLPLTPSDSKHITVETWNVSLGSAFIGNANHLTKPKKRLDGILTHIINFKRDIVALQEVFDPAMSSAVINTLTLNGYRVVHSAMPNGISFNSGLLVAVKSSIQIKAVKVYGYNNLISDDRFSAKGALKLTLDQNGFVFQFIATHLQASYGGPQYAQVRAEQIKALASLSSDKTILAGDFNCSPVPLYPTDPEDEFENYKKILSSFETSYNGESTFRPAYSDQSPLAKLDHIFVSKGMQILEPTVVDTNELSDHYPLLSSVTIVNFA